MSRHHGHQRRKAQPIGELVSALVDPMLQQRMGMTTQVMSSWQDIVGDDLSQMARPLKLDWPSRELDAACVEPATLTIECNPGMGVFVSHETRRMVSSLNLFFGFSAIGRIKVVQAEQAFAPTAAKPRSRKGVDPASIPTHLRSLIAKTDDERLRASLTRMGANMFSARS